MAPIHDVEQKQPAWDSDMTQSMQEQWSVPWVSKNISQTVQQYVMTYCIECCTQIEKSRDQSVVRITTGQRIIKDMKQGCLCTVLWSINWLKNMPPTFVFKVYIKEKRSIWFLCLYCTEWDHTHSTNETCTHTRIFKNNNNKNRNLKQSSNNLFWVCFNCYRIISQTSSTQRHNCRWFIKNAYITAKHHLVMFTILMQHWVKLCNNK